MLAVSHLQYLAHQQALLAQQAASSQYVTAAPAAGSWQGAQGMHRVVALPGHHQQGAQVYDVQRSSQDALEAALRIPSREEMGLAPRPQSQLLQGRSQQAAMHSEDTLRAMNRSANRLPVQSQIPMAMLRAAAHASANDMGSRGARTVPVISKAAAAPSWADEDWDPLKSVQGNKSHFKSGGTGVFLPPGTGVFLPPGFDIPTASDDKSKGPATPATPAAAQAATKPPFPSATSSSSSSVSSATKAPSEGSKLKQFVGFNNQALKKPSPASPPSGSNYDDLPASMLA